MRVPEGGQQRPLTRNGAPIVSCLARSGDCLRGVLSRMRRIKIQNGMGIGHGLGLGMFAPFGDGAFLGGVYPQVPLHLRRGGHLGLAKPSKTFKVWPLRGRLACHYLSGPLGVPLSPGPLSARLSGALPDIAKELLLPHRGGFANLRCAPRDWAHLSFLQGEEFRPHRL